MQVYLTGTRWQFSIIKGVLRHAFGSFCFVQDDASQAMSNYIRRHPEDTHLALRKTPISSDGAPAAAVEPTAAETAEAIDSVIANDTETLASEGEEASESSSDSEASSSSGSDASSEESSGRETPEQALKKSQVTHNYL